MPETATAANRAQEAGIEAIDDQGAIDHREGEEGDARYARSAAGPALSIARIEPNRSWSRSTLVPWIDTISTPGASETDRTRQSSHPRARRQPGDRPDRSATTSPTTAPPRLIAGNERPPRIKPSAAPAESHGTAHRPSGSCGVRRKRPDRPAADRQHEAAASARRMNPKSANGPKAKSYNVTG